MSEMSLSQGSGRLSSSQSCIPFQLLYVVVMGKNGPLPPFRAVESGRSVEAWYSTCFDIENTLAVELLMVFASFLLMSSSPLIPLTAGFWIVRLVGLVCQTGFERLVLPFMLRSACA